MIVDIEGVEYDLPDDATDAEILQFASGLRKPKIEEKPASGVSLDSVGKVASTLAGGVALPAATAVGRFAGEMLNPARAREVGGKLGQSAVAASESIPAAALGAGAMAVNAPNAAMQALGVDIPDNPIATRMEQSAQNYSRRAEARRPNVSGESDFMRGVISAPESLISNVAGVVLGGPLGAEKAAAERITNVMGGMVAGESYTKAREKGKTGAESTVLGVAQGATEKAFELMPIGQLLKDVKAGESLAKMLTKQLATEIPTEQATTFVQDLNDWAVLNPEKTFQDFMNERPSAALQTLGATVAQTGAMTGIAKTVDVLAGEKDKEMSAEKVQREIEALAREMGLIADPALVDDLGIEQTAETHRTSDSDVKLPKAIPMFRDETGDYTNDGTAAADVVPQYVPTLGPNVKLLEAPIAEAVNSGELELNDELKSELESGRFSDTKRAQEIAGLLQLKLDGIDFAHQINELGITKTKELSALAPEQLVAELQSLKVADETGFAIEGNLVAQALETDVVGEELQNSRNQELLYKMLNPMTEERRAEIQQKLERKSNIDQLPDAENPVALQSLDSFWKNGKESGLFSQAEEESPDIGGITDDVAEARERRYSPEILPPSLRTIEVASVKAAEGLTLKKLDKQPGTFGVGKNDRSFPREYQEAVVALTEAVRQKYMAPDSTVIVNFENFGKDNTVFGQAVEGGGEEAMKSTLGAHVLLEDGTHVITPRELASWDTNKSAYNLLTVNEAIYSLSHELGHAVWLSEFFRDMDKRTAAHLSNLLALDDLEQIGEMLELIPQAQADVLREWLGMREKVKTESARWFVENWLGVRKMALGVGKYSQRGLMQQRIYEWAERALSDIGKRLDGATALDVVHAIAFDGSLESEEESNRQAERYILSFNEYMAEQFSRHVYSSKLADSVLAKNPFFVRALRALRTFFKSLKTTQGEDAESVVKAGEKFETWVQGLSMVNASAENQNLAKKLKTNTKKRIVSRVKKSGQVKAVKKAQQSPEVIASEPPSELTLLEDEKIVKTLRAMVPLVRKERSDLVVDLNELIDFGQYEAAQQLILDTLGKKVNFDATYSYRFMDRLRSGKKDNTEYSRIYLDAFSRQKDVKKRERIAIEDLLNDNPDVDVFQAVVVEAYLAYHLVPFATIQSGLNSDFANNGWDRIERSPGNGLTVMLQAKDENLSTIVPTHFNHPRIFGHFRVQIEGDTAYVAEAQSDVMQRISSKKFAEGVQKMASRYPENVAIVKNMQRGFDERLLQEIMAWAAEKKLKRVAFAHENTMAMLEGHFRNDFRLDEDGVEELSSQIEDEDDLQSTILTFHTHDKEQAIAEYSVYQEYQAFEGKAFDPWELRTDTAIYRLTGDIELKEEDNNGFVAIEDLRVFYTIEPVGSYHVPAVLRGRVLNDSLHYIKNVALGNKTTNDQDYTDGLDNFQAMTDRIKEAITVTKDAGLTTVYRRHRNNRELFAQMFGGELELDQSLFPWHVAEVSPSMRMISLDTTKPGIVSRAKAINKVKNLKNTTATRAMNFTVRLGLALRQLQQIALENPGIIPLQVFSKLQQQYERMKNQLLVRPQQVADEWIDLSKKESDLLDALILSEREIGTHQTELAKNGALFVHRSSAKFDAWLTDNGVDLTTESGQKIKALFLNIKNAHLHQLNTLEAVVRDALWKRFQRETDVFAARWAEFKPLFEKMRKTVFVPNMQFGNYVLYVTEPFEQPDGRMKRETVFRRHFESEAERNRVYDEMKAKAKGDELVLLKNLTEEQALTMVIPSDFLQSIADTGAFAQAQIELMAELLVPVRVSKLEKRWENIANTIPGGSTNLFRNFAAYTWHNANFISKLRFNNEMNRAIAQMRSEVLSVNKLESSSATDVTKLDDILKTLMEVKSYVMHPPAEMEAARTGISLLYLMYMAKTALMNFSSVIHTVYGAQVEYGDLRGAQAFGKSIKMLTSIWGKTTKNGKSFATLEAKIENTTGKEQTYWKAVKFAMDKAVADGVVDQSYAYMLAGIANNGTRMKLYQNMPSTRWINSVFDGGMWAFRNVEKTNRLLSLMTFFELEYAKTGNESKAYEHAVKRTLALQNDYSRANRIKLTRGNKALFTIFLSYSQFMGWLATGGHDRTLEAEEKETGDKRRMSPVNFTTRLWVTYLLLGGAMGLPFAENLMDFITFIARRFGIADPEYFIRKFVNDALGMENVVMHGLLSNVAGVDVSNSFGLGRLVPGTEPISRAGESGFFPFVGEELVAMTGVFGNFAKSIFDMVSADSLDEAVKKAPGFIGAIGKAVSDYENGIMTAKGVRLNRDAETGEFVKQSPGTAALEVLGFQIAEVAKARRQNQMSFEIAKYYAYHQQMILANRNKAYFYKDAESLRSAEKDIEIFNARIPDEFKDLRITGKTKIQSFKRYKAAIKKAESGDAPTKKQQGVYDAVREVTDGGL